ncbi:MAG: hypothetical protein LBD84_03595 [Campylobacteraceae bacterium]|nr:hypothetical protein [Campylobacteraceae bacterium]
MNIIYIIEGENEEKLFRAFINNGYIPPGKIFVKNLMQNELENSYSIFDKKIDIVYCVIDTDVCKQCNIDVFKKNHKLLLEKTKRVYLLIQNKNLEQELSKALNKNCIELYKIFKCTKEKDFKSRFNKTTQLIQIIENCNINYKLLWYKYENFKNILDNSQKH